MAASGSDAWRQIGPLPATQATVEEERASKKSPMTDEEARALLSSVDEVILARGKARRSLPAKETTLDDLRGPTGGFRAPMLKVGRRLLVGFNPDLLRETL